MAAKCTINSPCTKTTLPRLGLNSLFICAPSEHENFDPPGKHDTDTIATHNCASTQLSFPLKNFCHCHICMSTPPPAVDKMAPCTCVPTCLSVICYQHSLKLRCSCYTNTEFRYTPAIGNGIVQMGGATLVPQGMKETATFYTS